MSLEDLEILTESLNSPRLNSNILHALLDQLADAYWIWEIDTGYDYLSDGWQRMLGYSADELPHHVSSWERLTHPDDLKKAYENVQDHFNSKGKIPYDVEFRMIMKSGRHKLVRATGAVIKWEGDKPKIMAGKIDDLERGK